VNRHAENLGKSLFDAVFEAGCDVVDRQDGKAAAHSAVAGNENLVVHAAHVDFMAIGDLTVFGL
jgi:hypothetical protein